MPTISTFYGILMRKKSAAQEDTAPRIVLTAPWRLTKVKPLINYTLEVDFIDGTHGFVDMRQLIMSDRAGVFATLKDKNIFNQAHLEYGAVTWPGEIDLAPDAMHREVKRKGTWILK